MATADERIKLLDVMIAIRPEAAWGILLKLLPEPTGGTSMPTHRPMWQGWANSWTRGATHNDMGIKFVMAVSERIVVLSREIRFKAVDAIVQESRPISGHPACGSIARCRARTFLRSLIFPTRNAVPVFEELSEQINRQRSFTRLGLGIAIRNSSMLLALIVDRT